MFTTKQHTHNTRLARTMLAAVQRPTAEAGSTLRLSEGAIAQLTRCFTGLPLPARFGKYTRELERVRVDRDGHYRVSRAQLTRWLTVLADVLPVAQRSREDAWRSALPDLLDVQAWGARV